MSNTALRKSYQEQSELVQKAIEETGDKLLLEKFERLELFHRQLVESLDQTAMGAARRNVEIRTMSEFGRHGAGRDILERAHRADPVRTETDLYRLGAPHLATELGVRSMQLEFWAGR